MGTLIPVMSRASQGVLAKQVWPGTRHSSSAEEGHHWRSEQVSDWMSAKEEPQKNLYFRSELGWAETVVVVMVVNIVARIIIGILLEVDDAMINLMLM